MTTRAEHIAWCKERAHKEYEFYKVEKPDEAIRNAATSMLSDLGKHPETARLVEGFAGLLAINVMMSKSERELFRFIDGFN